jgi:hypothetical protein
VIAVVGRFVDLSAPPWRLGDLGGTIGHRVFVGGFVAAAIVSSSAMPRRPRTYAALLVLGSGLAVTAARSAWIAVIVGLIIVLIRGRNWKVAVGVLAPVAISLTAWTVADHYLPESRLEFSAASRFTELTVGSSRERPAAFKAFSRAWLDNPVLGTGAGTGWYAYLTHVRVDEMRIGGRRFGDAHNIVLETAVTHGGIGVLALLALGGLTLVKTKSAPADRAWALGVAAAVGIVQLVEPLSLVLTPLMFLTAGLAMRDPPDRKKIALSRWVAIPLTVALLISTIDLTASSLERYGAQYGSEKAFRWSIRLGPWRLLTPLLLANLRAFDYRQGERSAAIETDTLVRNAVKRHAWNPNVRLNGANVEILLDDFMAARDLYNDQLSIFPLDPDALAGAAQIAIHNGDFGGAAKLARESLELDPSQKRARSALEAAKRGQRDGNYKKP